MNLKARYIGSLKLSAIGDALGWMTEFENSKNSIEKKFGTNHIDTFYDWEKIVGGRFYGYKDIIKAGSYSDDTQLLLSVSRSIMSDGILDLQYFSKQELPDWLLYARGAGRTIKNAARKIKRKSAKWNNNFFKFKIGKATVDYRESGANGAAMRILPIALANFGKPEKIKEEIFANSIITHGHPRAILGAMLYGYAINTVLRYDKSNLDYTSFLSELGKNIHQKFSIEFLDSQRFINWEKEWDRNSKTPFRVLYNLVLNETLEYLRTAYKLIKANTSDSEVLNSLGCYEYDTKGSGTSTVIAGIYFTCKYLKQPIKGIEEAVNAIGTDTDSIAAFTGGLLGALYGVSIIPKKWDHVQDANYIQEVAIRLYKVFKNQSDEEHVKNIQIDSKLIMDIKNDDINVNQKVFLGSLGNGIISSINRENALTSGKYNLIFDVQFENGQFCRFSKLLNIEDSQTII